MDWYVRDSNPVGGTIFQTPLEQPQGPSSLLYNGYWVSLPAVKRHHPTPSSIRSSTAITLPPLYACLACHGEPVASLPINYIIQHWWLMAEWEWSIGVMQLKCQEEKAQWWEDGDLPLDHWHGTSTNCISRLWTCYNKTVLPINIHLLTIQCLICRQLINTFICTEIITEALRNIHDPYCIIQNISCHCQPPIHCTAEQLAQWAALTGSTY